MREPRWWYAADGGGVMPRLLAPLGWAYGTLAARRMSEPPRLTARVPVVCIGNFTAGGTGKTPFVRVAVAALRAAGHTPVVLTRGYGGRITGTHLVDLRHDTARDVGDEALLLARDGLVVVARDRAAGALNIENAIAPNATVIVLDDRSEERRVGKEC